MSQGVAFTPIDPVRGTPQKVQPILLWMMGSYGAQTANVSGVSADFGNTLLLNSVAANTNATASWTIPFPVAFDLSGKSVNVTAWLPAYQPPSVGPTALVLTESKTTPVDLTVVGHHLSYQPTVRIKEPWWPQPLYVPDLNASTQLPQLYANFTGGYRYIPLSFSINDIPSQLTISITVPPHSQVWLPNVMISVAPLPAAASSSGQGLGIVFLPVLGLAVIGIVWLLRRIRVSGVTWTLGAGVSLQLALAPLFLHTDLVTLEQYPLLLYQYGIVNLQSMIYGPAYYASLVVPPAPYYAVGVSPTSNTLNVLFKLTPIAFAGLTYVLLFRVLERRIGRPAAYRWSTFGWLFNPLVVYVSAVHGLAEPVVAFFVLLAVSLVWDRRYSIAAVATTVGSVALFPAALVIAPIAAVRRAPPRFIVSMVVLPVLAMGIIFGALYRAWQPLLAYSANIFRTGSYQNFPAYGGAVTLQSPWSLPVNELGLFPNLLVVVVAVVAAFAVIRWKTGGLPLRYLPAAAAFTLLLFCAAYTNFSTQLLVWTVPVMVLLLTIGAVNDRRAFALVLGAGTVGVFVDSMNTWAARADTLVAMILFAALFAPMVAVASSLWNGRGRWVLRGSVVASVVLPIAALGSDVGFFSKNLAGTVAVLVVFASQAFLLYQVLRSDPFTPRGTATSRTLILLSTAAALGVIYVLRPPAHPVPTAAAYVITLTLSVTVLVQLVWEVSRWLRVNPRSTSYDIP